MVMILSSCEWGLISPLPFHSRFPAILCLFGPFSSVFCELSSYVLKDVQRLTGLPLVGENKEIKPLAWFMTIVVQLMPFGELRF